MRIRRCSPAAPIRPPRPSSDLLVRSYVRTYGFPGVITRSSNNYGPYQFPEKFLPLMITNAMDDKPLPIYGDGKQQRDWLHVEDNCRGVLAVLERGRIGEVYNIGGLDIEENLTIARTLLRLIGQTGNSALLREGSPRTRSSICPALRQDGEGPRLETGCSARRRSAADHRLVQDECEVDGGRTRRRLSLLLREILRKSRLLPARAFFGRSLILPVND